jgi:hypothetical protein
MATTEKKTENQNSRATKGNGGNQGNAKGFDEQHGARGSQLNANTTGNTGKSKKRGA